MMMRWHRSKLLAKCTAEALVHSFLYPLHNIIASVNPTDAVIHQYDF